MLDTNIRLFHRHSFFLWERCLIIRIEYIGGVMKNIMSKRAINSLTNDPVKLPKRFGNLYMVTSKICLRISPIKNVGGVPRIKFCEGQDKNKIGFCFILCIKSVGGNGLVFRSRQGNV